MLAAYVAATLPPRWRTANVPLTMLRAWATWATRRFLAQQLRRLAPGLGAEARHGFNQDPMKRAACFHLARAQLGEAAFQACPIEGFGHHRLSGRNARLTRRLAMEAKLALALAHQRLDLVARFGW